MTGWTCDKSGGADNGGHPGRAQPRGVDPACDRRRKRRAHTRYAFIDKDAPSCLMIPAPLRESTQSLVCRSHRIRRVPIDFDAEEGVLLSHWPVVCCKPRNQSLSDGLDWA